MIRSNGSVVGACPSPKKRTASSAELDGRPLKQTKRRASKACQSCRSRKVRCNVVEQSPCTNCRLDEVECIISESKRKKKPSIRLDDEPTLDNSPISRVGHNHQASPRPWPVSPRHLSALQKSLDEHMPHPLYRNMGRRPTHIPDFPRPIITYPSWPQNSSEVNVPPQTYHPSLVSPALSDALLPDYIKPLPQRIGSDEVAFLFRKGALTLPAVDVRDALLQSYVEHVDPLMPIFDMNEFLKIVDAGDGSTGQISLLLFQAVLFTASASVDMHHLNKAGFATRKDARKSFYLRTRLLYDFDYDTDRVALIQALLLMSYWFETPDDQKDTWHWMGLAISTAHAIGMNRNPSRSSLDPRRQRQWKRIAWTLMVRDRVISLGLRKPSRIHATDFDVPMLTLGDFEMTPLPDEVSCIPPECVVARNVEVKNSLALMFIAKAKLSLCIGRILLQYAVSEQSINEEGRARDSETLVVPKHSNDEASVINYCHKELEQWMNSLPKEVQLLEQAEADGQREEDSVKSSKGLLHMIYYTTLSYLHRPQAMQSAAQTNISKDCEFSTRLVHHAATRITEIACNLLSKDLVRFLPTTGVTVMLPAITHHLMEIKSQSIETRHAGLVGFCHCIQVMSRLRICYAAADFTMLLVDAAIRKADIDIPSSSTAGEGPAFKATCNEHLVAEGIRRKFISAMPNVDPPTPPPEAGGTETASPSELNAVPLSDATVKRHVELFLATYQPTQGDNSESQQYTPVTAADQDREFESLIDFDNIGEALSYGDNGFRAMQGESSGFTYDLDWIHQYSVGPASVIDSGDDAAAAGNQMDVAGDEDDNDADGGADHLTIPLEIESLLQTRPSTPGKSAEDVASPEKQDQADVTADDPMLGTTDREPLLPLPEAVRMTDDLMPAPVAV